MARGDKLLELVNNQLQVGEVIRGHAHGSTVASVGGKPMKVTGIFVVTDSRVGFFAKWLGGSNFSSVRFEDITAISSQRSLVGLMTLEITSANESLVVSSVKDSEGSSLLQLIDNARSKPLTNANGPTSSNVAVMLGELADLRDRGILTSEEFESKKRELLDRL